MLRSDLVVEAGSELSSVGKLRVHSGTVVFEAPVDFAPIVEDGETAETWVFEELLVPVRVAGEVTFSVSGEEIGAWRLENVAWLRPDEVPPGRLVEVLPVPPADGAGARLRARFSRSIVELPSPGDFILARLGPDGETLDTVHLGLDWLDPRTVDLLPLSGGRLEGRYTLLFRGGQADTFGQPLDDGRLHLEIPPPVEADAGGASPAGAVPMSTISLPLEESPPGSGLLTAFTSGTFDNLGRGFMKTFEVELETGDQLSVYMYLIEAGARYNLRVEDITGTELFGGYWGTVFPIQRLEIPAAGTYRVQAYVSSVVTDFDLRIDVGRNLFLEAENNDTPGASNTLTFKPASGGFQESAGGALADLRSNSSWGGSNDVNGDFFDLGTLSTGNSIDVTYQLPNGSTLEPGDLELAIFADGALSPTGISINPLGLSTTVPADGRYFLRVAPNDNLDGTALKFHGGSDRVDLPAAAIDGLNVFTLEFWARGRPDSRALISGANASRDNEVLVWFQSATELRYYDAQTFYSWTVPPMDVQTWRHYAIVRDGGAGTLELFVDGVSRGSLAGKTTPPVVTHFLLGQDQDSPGGGFEASQAFIGNMDDFRIWETARSASEIADNQKTILSGDEPGLRAWYRFNEGTGSTTADETANAFDSTLVGPVFDGDVNAAGFNPARIGIRAQYYTTVTVIDSVPPVLFSTSFPEVSGDGYFTYVTLNFSEDVNPETAGVGAHYDLRSSGPDGLFDTAEDAVYTIQPLTYLHGTEVILFLPDGPLQPGDYRFRATAAIEDRAGNPLVPYETTFTLDQLGDFIIENRDNDSPWSATKLGVVVSPVHDGSFNLAEAFPAVDTVWAGAVDLNGNRLPDVLAINDASYLLEVYLNNGDGTFTAGAAYSLVDNAYDAVLVDLDNDGDLDVAMAGRDDDEVRVFFNNGDGTLAAGPVIPVGDGPRGIAAGDLDGDGWQDLVSANEFDGTLSLLLNNGAGASFTVQSLPQPGADPQRLVVGNFDADPALDIVYTDNANRRVGFLAGAGDGTFADPVYSEVDPNEARPDDIDSADFDGDGILDLAVSHDNSWSTSSATVLFGNGDGTFGDAKRLPIGSQRTEFTIGDINDDGIPDLVGGNYNALYYFLGTGDRAVPFQPGISFGNLRFCYGLAIGDFDNDGRTDILASETRDDRFHLLSGNPTRRPLADATAPGFYQALGRGNLRDTDDADWYSFTARRGEGIVLLTENANTGDSSAGLNYRIYGPGINQRLTSNSGFTGGRMQMSPYTIPTDGTYYIRVARSNNYFSEYRLRLTIAPPDYQLENESNNATTSANAITLERGAGQLGARVLGQLMPGDTSGDFFALGNLALGSRIDLAYHNTEDSTASPRLWVYSRSGSTNTIEAETPQGDNTLSFTAVADGTYFARVTTVNEDLDFFSEYRLEITITDSEPPSITGDNLPAEGSSTDDLLIGFTLTFNENLYPPSFNEPAHFELRGAGPDGLFNTADDFTVPLGNFSYTAGTSHLLTIDVNPLQPGQYRFTAFAGGIEDLFGNPLPDDYVRNFSVVGLPDYLTESTDNDTFLTADPLTTNPPGGNTGSYTLHSVTAIPSDGPQALQLVDVDGDGIPDAVVTSSIDDRLLVYFGNGDATFTPGPAYPLGGDVLRMGVADFDADGLADLLLPERGSPAGLRLFRNNGDGTLSDAGLLPGGVNPSVAAAGDFDGQNGVDLVMVNVGSGATNGSMSLYIQQPDGTFAHSQLLEGLGLRPYDVEVADFDGDGKLDIAFSDYAGRQVGLMLGNGDGSFADPVYYPVANVELGLMAGADFDGDGAMDLVVGHNNHAAFSLLLNNGDGTFAGYQAVSIGNNRNGHIEALDLNDDGRPDVVVTGDFGVSWTYNLPGAELFSGPAYSTDPSPNDLRGVAAADLDGDGLTDLVAAAWNTDALVVYLGDADYSLAQTAGFDELFEVFARGRDILLANNPDHYAFSARAGQKLLVDVGSDISAWASHGFALFDSFGNSIFSGTLFYGYEQFGPFTIPRDGNYYFRATGNNGDDIYRFRLSLVDNSTQPESEANNSASQADPLTFSQAPGIRQARVFGTAPAAEDTIDWFRLGNLAENAQITATFTQPADSGLTPTLSLRAGNGSIVRTTAEQGATQLTYTLNAGEEEFHYITVSFAGQNFKGRYFLDIVIEDLQPPEITGLTLPAEGATSSDFIVSTTLSFSEDLQPAGVTDPSSYILVNAGPDNTFGTDDDFSYAVQPQSYTTGLSVSLALVDQPLQPGLHRFRIPANALRDLFDNPLAEDFVREFAIEGIVPFIGESLENDFLEDGVSLSTSPNDFHDGSFLLSAQWTTATRPQDLLVLYADGDGWPDVMVASGAGTTELELFLNDGSGGFMTPVSVLSLTSPDEPVDLAGADFNNNGLVDVALSVRTTNNAASARVIWLENNGDGSFTEVFSDAAPTQPGRMATGDFDGDGFPDLVAVERSGSPRALSIFLNDGSGAAFTREAFTDLGDGADPVAVAVADFDLDGNLDIAVADFANQLVILLAGAGDGTFTRVGEAALSVLNPVLLQAGDLDGDGLPDLVAGFNLATSIDVLRGNGDLTFAEPVRSFLRENENQTELLVDDVNGDGLLDVVVGMRRVDGFTVFSGQRGAGYFLGGAQTYEEPTRVHGLGSADFDGDGRTDLVVADYTGNYLAMYPGIGGMPLSVDTSVVGLRYGMGRGTLRNAVNSSDTDFWTFSVRAGDRIFITSENTGNAFATNYTHRLYTAGGDQLQSFTTAIYGGVGQSPPFIVDYTGRVYLSISRSSAAGVEYRFNVNLVPGPAQIETENNDNATQANSPVFTTTPGQQEATIFGVVDREDTSGDHFFLGNLAGGTSIQLRLTLPDNSLLDPRLQIYRAGDPPLAQTTTSVPAIDATVPPDAGGAYYARIDGTATTRGIRGTYLATLRLLDSVPPEITGSSLPEAPSAEFFPSITLFINEDFAPGTVNDPAAFELREAGPDGTFGTGDDQLVALGSPSYTVGSSIVLPLPDNPLPPGQYRLTAFASLKDKYDNSLPADFTREFTMAPLPGFITESIGNDTPATATRLLLDPVFPGIASIGGRGRLTGAAEMDYWAVAAEAGQRMVLDIDFPGSPSISALQFLVTAPDGASVLLDTVSNRNGAYTTSGALPLDQTGDYVIRVDRGSDAYLGEYRFRTTVLDPGVEWETEDNNTTAAANTVTLFADDAGFSGEFFGVVSSALDRDFVSLGVITPGNTLFLSADASANGPLVPVVSVYRVSALGDDVFISEVPSGRNGDGVVEINVTEEHEYFALVRGSSATGGLMSEYRLSVLVLPTALANFPNLQVTSVSLPGAGFLSGDLIPLEFTVTNVGADGTAVSGWIDRAVISSNNIFGDGDDYQLAVVNREGALGAGESYTVSTSARLPDGVSGSFFIIVRTDTADQVDEFLFEGDNELASSGTFNVGLANYPDLVVEDLVIPEPSVSGDLTITWQTANRGAGPVDGPFIERVQVLDRVTGGVVYSSSDALPGGLAAGAAIARSLPLTGLVPANYRVRIDTDFADDHFEYGAGGHLAAEENRFSGDFIVYRFFNVSTSSSPTEGGTTSGGGMIREGNSVTVTAVPDTGVKPYSFVRWKRASGELLTTDPVYNFIPAANTSLIAEFELPLYTIQTTRNIGAAGTVSGAGGYRWGSLVSIQARTNPGYLFERYEDAADDSVLGTDAVLPLTVTADRTVRAVFAEQNPTHDVTVTTEPAGVAATGGDGVYNNGEVLNLSVPATVVDLPTEYIFQQWALNGASFSGNPDASKTFSTLDPPVMAFVAKYQARNYKPVVSSLTSLVSTSKPVPGGALFGVTLTFDRAMDTAVAPSLSLASANAALAPLIPAGRWLDSQRWESGTLQFVPENTGDYTLQVADATGTDGRVMDPADVLAFTVDATPPPNPDISIVSLGDGTATIGWQGYPAPADLNNFRVYLRTEPFASVTALEAIDGAGAAARQYTFTGLEHDTDYHAAVTAVDTSFNSDPNVTPLLVRINSDIPPPVSVTLDYDTPESAVIDWSGYDASGLLGFEGFLVFREESGFSDVTGLTPVATLGPDQTSHHTGSLDRTRSYHFAVVGINRVGGFNPLVDTVTWSDPLSGDITKDRTFGGEGQAGIDILGPITVLDGATLTILPGTTLYFAAGAGITVESGVLLAAGTALEPVVFTSILDDGAAPPPQAGDWTGIRLLDTTRTSVLEHLWILHGAGFESAGADPAVFALGLVKNSGPGILVSSGAAFSGEQLYLALNGAGIETRDAGSSATLSGSVLKNNSGPAALAGPDTSISATGNWWGSANPDTIAGLVSGAVDSSGFLTGEPLLGTALGLDAPILQTTNDQVSLLLGAMNATAYRLSEDSTFSGVPFIDLETSVAGAFVATASWLEQFTLSEGAGTKTIFAEFLSPTGGQPQTLQLDLLLIDEGPSITGWNLSEGDLLQRPLEVVASATSPVGIKAMRMEADGLSVLSSASAALAERWDISAYGSGIYRMRLVAEDLSGNLATRSINVTIDPQPTAAPVISTPLSGTLLAVDSVDVAGMAEPLIPVRLTVNGTFVGATTADAAGNFSFAGVPLLEGDNSLIATGFDAAGSTASPTVLVISDTQSPLAPVLEQPLYDPQTGLIIQWRFANATGEQPSRYKVFWNSTPFDDPADAIGASGTIDTQSWIFEDQPNGAYYFRVVGYDSANNASDPSNQVSTLFDDTPPVIEIFYDKPTPVGAGELVITLQSNEPLKAVPALTVQPEGRRLPISVPLAETGPRTWQATFIVSDASMRSGEATVLVTARDTDNNLYSGAPVGPPLLVDLTRPTGVLRTNVEAPLQVLNPVQIELTLELSEPVGVGTTPSLRWSPPTGAEVDVALTGAEDVWTGTLTLFPEMGKGDGLFLMQATDAVGNTGTLLTSGATFEVYNTLLPDPPGPPPQLLAQALAGGHVQLDWLEAYRARTYNVYRVPAAQSGTPNFLVAEGIMGTRFTDLPPEDGLYRYVVTASRFGAEGSPSPSFTVTSDRTPPPPPENIAVALGVNGVVVTFDPPSGGETPHRYVLYRNGSPLNVSSPMPGSLRDFPPRGVMEYQVASSDVYGNHALTGIASIEMFLGPVKDMEVLVEPGQPVRLTWARTDPITEGYNLYRNGVRQNPAILSSAFYSDPLSPGNQPVEYAVTAVNDQGQESAARQVIVQPVSLSFLLNPDEAGEEFESVAGFFDNYRIKASLPAAAGAVSFNFVQIERELDSGTAILRSGNPTLELAPGAEVATDLVIPSPLEVGVNQTSVVTLATVPDSGNGRVLHRASRFLPGAFASLPAISLVAENAPLAGGLTDFSVTFANRGRTEADFLLVRKSGAEPGEFSIGVSNDEGQEVAVTLFDDIIPGLTFNARGDGFLRLAPGGTATFTVPDVFVPITLAEAGEATFTGTLGTLYYRTGSPAEDQTGPLTGTRRHSLTETSYFGTSGTARGIYSNEEIITITGQALDRDTGDPVPDVPLKLGFEIQGFTFYRELVTDEFGDYSYDFMPTAGLGGTINIWAAHPDVVDQISQTSVVLYRSFLSPARGNIRMSKNDILDFQIELINVGDRDLTAFDVEARAYTVGEDESETDIGTLAVSLREPVASPVGARKRVPVKLRLQSTLDAPDNAVVEISLTSAEGARSTFTGLVSLLPAIPLLDVVSPRVGYVDLTVNRGDIVSRQVTVTNRGLRPLEDVVLTPPQALPWMQVNLPVGEDGLIRLPDLAVGDNFTFSVVYTPPQETAIGFHDDFIIISGSNAVADYRLNLFAQVGSSEVGDAEFFVDNNLVLPIPGASIRLRNVALGIERGPEYTDANGFLRFEDLQEGKWSWTISAPSHESKAGTVDIVPDQTAGVDIRLGKSMVSIKFSVVPVPFTDRYEIKIEQTFETRVPAPVIVFSPPKFDFETNDPFEVDVIYSLTNHGLVSIFDVEVKGSEDKYLRLTPLIDFLPELKAQQTVEIPAKIVFSGFNSTLAALPSTIGASPQLVGGDIPGPCGGGPSTEEVLAGIAAIAKMGADGGYACADGDLGTAAAVALAAASAYKAATEIPGSVAGAAIALVGKLIGCFDFSGLLAPGSSSGSGRSGPSSPASASGGGGACFVAGTSVHMADGSLRPIELLRAGDALLTGADGGIARIAQAYTLSVDRTVRVELDDGTAFRCATGHRIWVDGIGWLAAGSLEPGQWLQARDGTFPRVLLVETVHEPVRVYTFQLNGESAFYANGILVEDLCGGQNLEPSLLRRMVPLDPDNGGKP